MLRALSSAGIEVRESNGSYVTENSLSSENIFKIVIFIIDLINFLIILEYAFVND